MKLVSAPAALWALGTQGSALTSGSAPADDARDVGLLEVYSTILDAFLGSDTISIASSAEVAAVAHGVAAALEAWAEVRAREAEDEAARSFATVGPFISDSCVHLAGLLFSTDHHLARRSCRSPPTPRTLRFAQSSQAHSHIPLNQPLPFSVPTLLAPTELQTLLTALSDNPPPQAWIHALASFLDWCLDHRR